jgi:hypothetical protein
MGEIVTVAVTNLMTIHHHWMDGGDGLQDPKLSSVQQH